MYKYTNQKTLLAMSVAAAFALSGCSSDDDKNEPDPVEPPPVTVTVPPDTIVTEQPAKVFSANVIDLTNADVLEGAMVTFLVDGEAATNLTDVNGEDLNMVTVDDSGNFTFLSKEGATGAVTAQVTFDGYISKSFVVDLDTEVEEDTNEIALQFALIAAESEGLAQASTEVEVTSATTTEAIEVKADKDGAKSDVTIPAGTTLKDANGDAISGGTVKLNVLAADSSNTNAGVIIPEGLNADSTTTVKTSLGVTDITMSAGETKIKQFDPAINVSVTLPADSDVAEGDTLVLSSHDETTGKWQQEQNVATVGAANADGTFPATFDTSHLTFFSLGKNVELCSAGITLKLVGTIPARGLAIELSSTDGTIGSYTRKEIKHVIPASSAARYGISKDAKAKVRLYDYSGNVWYNSETEIAVCGEIEVNIGSTVETFDKNVTLSGSCATDATKTADLSGSIVTYAKDGKAASLAQSQGAGTSTFKLSGVEVGGTYKVRATIRGAKVQSGGQSQTFTFDNVQNDGNALTGAISLQCNQIPVTGG